MPNKEPKHSKARLAEIRTRQLQHARALLIQGDMSVNEVATVCGFEGSMRFPYLYKEQFGEYPSVTLKWARTMHKPGQGVTAPSATSGTLNSG